MGVNIMSEFKGTFKQQAIVLYIFEGSGQRVVLFDKHLGKIICYISYRDLFVGAHIEYELIKKRRYYTAHAINIIRIPFAVAQRDIRFLHHVIELCYYFLPERVDALDVFTLVEYLYIHEKSFVSPFAKILYISKLFILFGIYPEKPYIENKYWQQLLTESIDTILDTCGDAGIERELTAWVRLCIQMHPRYHTFKTVEYVSE